MKSTTGAAATALSMALRTSLERRRICCAVRRRELAVAAGVKVRGARGSARDWEGVSVGLAKEMADGWMYGGECCAGEHVGVEEGTCLSDLCLACCSGEMLRCCRGRSTGMPFSRCRSR